VRGAASASLLVLVSVACGSAAPPPTDREWAANAHGTIRQLRDDVLAAAAVDPRRALHDDASLYPALIVFTDFSGCRHMVAALGSRPRRDAPAERDLDDACVRLQRAAALFTRAVRVESVTTLQKAIDDAQRALVPLNRAELQLRRE
jgi:hypothetical protein